MKHYLVVGSRVFGNKRYQHIHNKILFEMPTGVMHADEIMYLFTMPIPHNETEVELSRRMIEVWTTFAKYG